MTIRRHIDWDGKMFFGHVSVGVDNTDDNAPVAKEALMFHLVFINSCWKIPLGYFLVDSITGDQLHVLINQSLQLLRECNITVAAITFDGARGNLSAARKFGCDLMDMWDYKTHFTVNGNEHPISFFLDPAHMLKLVRNTLADYKEIFDTNMESIKWDYLDLLVTLQEHEGLKLGNKLTRAHIFFTKQKMKVKLAAQLFSNSVADALQYCLDNNVSGFEGCAATIRFIRIFNRLFDILNSRSIHAKYSKQALHPGNIEETKKFLEDTRKYILALRTRSQVLICTSNRKTGFMGFLCCIQSTVCIYDHYVANAKYLKYFPVYKSSQDHIERLFGYLRSRNGHNNNPTARELYYSMKKIWVHRELHESSSSSGNAIPLDKIRILRPLIQQSPEEGINKTTGRIQIINESEENELDLPLYASGK